MSHVDLNLALATMSNLLRVGDVESLARYFKLPLPFYEDDHLVVLSRLDQIVEAIQKYHRETKAEGAIRFDPEVVQIERHAETACLCLVRWRHLGLRGEVLSHHDARYMIVVKEPPKSFQIEIVECGHSVATKSCLPSSLLRAG